MDTPLTIKELDALADAMKRHRIKRMTVGDVEIEMDLPPLHAEPLDRAAVEALTAGRKPMSREDLLAWATGEELPSERAAREAQEAARRSAAAHTAKPVQPVSRNGKT